jgi:hypothetical protein
MMFNFIVPWHTMAVHRSRLEGCHHEREPHFFAAKFLCAAVGHPMNPFAFAASDLGVLAARDHGSCYADEVFTTFFPVIGVLPPCP